MAAQAQDNIPQAKEVGRGLQAPLFNPEDPQWFLAGSNHPYTPFPGNALKWNSYVYDDGTTYEGLTRDDVPHMKGTLVMGNGTGGGFQNPIKGDVFEGEFEAGYAHGLGQYIGAKGEIYRGEFKKGQRNGCGMIMNVRPYLNRLKKGDSPAAAWAATYEKIDANTRYGTWQSDLFLTGPSEDAAYCHIEEIRGVLQELDSVTARTRMFRNKPDGEVGRLSTYKDARGAPITVMQDPLHYPHGTGFMAPGPMGQTHPIPDDPALKESMARTARNWKRIYDMYNVERDPQPGSAQFEAERLGKEEEEAQEKAYQEMMAAEKRRLKRLERLKTTEDKSEAKAVPAPKAVAAADDEDDEDVDDEDLTVASVGKHGPAGGWGRPGFGGPTAFASISLGMNRATHVIGNAFSHAASRAHRRPRLARPSDMK